MQISKTTTTGIVGLLTIVLAKFGFNVDAGILAVIVTAIVAVLAKFTQDQNDQPATVHAFAGSFGASSLIIVLPAILDQVGEWVIKKDGATKGWKTAAGNLIKAFAPVITSILGNSESGFKKALRGVRDTIDNYLANSGSQPAPGLVSNR